MMASGQDLVYVSSKWHKVQGVNYCYHDKSGRPRGIKATYTCGLRQFNDWILPEHPGYAGIAGRNKLAFLGHKFENLDKAMKFLTDRIVIPSKVLIDNTGRYPNVIEIELEKPSKGV